MKTEFLKVSTFARKKGVSVLTVYKWIKIGKLQAKEIDGVKFIECILDEAERIISPIIL